MMQFQKQFASDLALYKNYHKPTQKSIFSGLEGSLLSITNREFERNQITMGGGAESWATGPGILDNSKSCPYLGVCLLAAG